MALPSSVLQRGLRSAQPVATTVAAGTIYYVTDESVTEWSDGSAWQTYSRVSTYPAATGITVGTVKIVSGSGSPEAVVTAPIGSLFLRTDGSTSTTLYVKTSGAGNTGWTAK